METRNNNGETSKSIMQNVEMAFAEKQKGMPLVLALVFKRENPYSLLWL
jgi:hypothetical protein